MRCRAIREPRDGHDYYALPRRAPVLSDEKLAAWRADVAWALAERYGATAAYDRNDNDAGDAIWTRAEREAAAMDVTELEAVAL